MQPSKIKLAFAAGAVLLGASNASNAATGTFDITVATIADVVLTEKEALTFGSNMFTTALSTCTMGADEPESDGAVMQYEDTAAVTAAASLTSGYGVLAGTGCVVGAVANPGVYRIAGTSGSTVNITIGSLAAGGDFSFVPDEGCIVTYGTASAADSLDTCATFTADNVVTTRLSLATATEEGSAAPGVTVDGQLVFTVGGTITIGAVDLNPATVYTANFPVTVVY